MLIYARVVGDGLSAFENAHNNMVTIQAVSPTDPGVIRDLVDLL